MQGTKGITIFQELNEKEGMAKTLSQKLGMYRETISRILTRLSNLGYVIYIDNF